MAGIQMCCRPLHNRFQFTLPVKLGQSSWISHTKKLATTQQDKDVVEKTPEQIQCSDTLSIPLKTT